MILRFYTISSILLLGLLTNITAQDCDSLSLIFEQTFDQYIDSSKVYTLGMVESDFPNVSARTSGEIRGLSSEWPQENRVENGELRAQYLMNDASARSGGFLFDSSFEGVEEAVLEYKVKFDSSFIWATGGKLPGLGGAITQSHGIPAGCTQNEDIINNAFSCRLMWRRNREHTQPPYIIVYPYFPNRTTNCGGTIPFIRDIVLDKWYTIKQYIRLNTPGQEDGILQMFVDDTLRHEENNVLYRLAGKDDVLINSLVMHTYRGGKRDDTVWHSPTTDYIYFDDFRIWTNCNIAATENVRPEVYFMTPTGDTTVAEGYSLFVEALASDQDGLVDNVEVFINGEPVRMEKVVPYEWGHANSPDPDELNNLPVGEHEIKAVVTDNRGSKNEATFTLTVEQSSSLNDLSEAQKESISIYPTPFSDVLTISTDYSLISSVTLYSSDGKIIRQEQIDGQSKYELETSDLESGIYFIKCRDTDNTSIVKKVIKN